MIIFREPLDEFEKREDPAQMGDYWGAWGAYIGAMRAAGIIVKGDGLLPPAMATTVRMRDGARLIEDGPFADVKEQLGGYFVIEVPDLDAAIDWAGRSPAALVGSVEVRPVMPADMLL
ncbi:MULTISPECIES: YciI family protein [Roseicyclus]|uniref:YciI family protein n=1 Tax=Roseicyclus amphidinii TaxID=3034232 RepID=UPI0024E0A783|nr:YciI family protein [Roseicyclus sp. Amp-Y-6]